MSKANEEQFNRIYAKDSKAFGDVEPSISRIPELVPQGNVFDAGAGQGRNALWLAEQGYEVTAVEISRVGAQAIRRQAEESGLNINVIEGDVVENLVERYDVIDCMMALHFLSDRGPDFIGQMQDHTNVGGVNVVRAFLNQGDIVDNSTHSSYFPSPGELEEIYSDWDVIEYLEEETLAKATMPDGRNMQNLAATLIARKVDHHEP